MVNWRIWIFRALVLIACVLMLVSFIQPWWIGNLGKTGNVIHIYGWGLRHNLSALASYISKDVTPTWQVALAWVYVVASIILALYSTWIKRWWGQLLLGFVGLGLIAYAAVAINVVVKNRLATFYIPLEGYVSVGQDIVIYANIQSGYYLAYIAGGIMVTLALLRSLIMGKSMKD